MNPNLSVYFLPPTADDIQVRLGITPEEWEQMQTALRRAGMEFADVVVRAVGSLDDGAAMHFAARIRGIVDEVIVHILTSGIEL